MCIGVTRLAERRGAIRPKEEKDTLKVHNFQNKGAVAIDDTPELQITDKPLWDIAKNPTSDEMGQEYALAIIDYAERWGKLMQVRVEAGELLEDIADETSHEADLGDITGSMYNHALRLLTGSWKYGSDLRRWHDTKWSTFEDLAEV